MAMKEKRNRSRPLRSLQERLAALANQARAAAKCLPAGRDRRDLLRKARASENAAEIERWLSSPGLRSPE